MSLAFTTMTPLLFSIAIVIILLYPSDYERGWAEFFCDKTIPKDGFWWIATLFILLFTASWIWSSWFLGRLKKRKRGIKTITLSSLQYHSSGNFLSMLNILPPWITLFVKDDVIVLISMTAMLSLIITYVMSRRGYSSLIFLLSGYRMYEGEDRNKMKIQLLSKRMWRSTRDIQNIVFLSDNFALVV